MANKKTHRPADERLQEALAQVARLQAKVHADTINSNPTIQDIDAQIKQAKADRQQAKLAASQWEDKYNSFLVRANLWKEKGANAEADIKSLDALLNDLQNRRNGAVSEISSAIAG